MLETQLYFNFKDMFRAPRLALGRRMLVMLEALGLGYFVLLIMTYLGLLIEGWSFGKIWSSYHLLPPIFTIPADGFWGSLLFYLAYAILFVLVYIGFTAVAKITIKEYKGDLFYSSRDGWSWALKNWFPTFFGPISILIVIAFFLILAIIFGWLAQWPVLDILFYGLLFVIYLPTAVFLAYSVLSFVVGLFMSPSIVACAEEDTMGSMFGAYTLLWNQPTRLITYLLMLTGLTFIGYHLFGLFILAGFKLLEMVFSMDWLMGTTFLATKQVSLNLFGGFEFLPSYWQVPECLTALCKVDLVGTGVTTGITGVLVGLVSLLGFLAVPAYGLATIATGLATAFIVLTKHKDDDDLIKRLDADERAEKEAEEQENDEASEEDAESTPTESETEPETDTASDEEEPPEKA